MVARFEKSAKIHGPKKYGVHKGDMVMTGTFQPVLMSCGGTPTVERNVSGGLQREPIENVVLERC
jgi:hypothetical protein